MRRLGVIGTMVWDRIYGRGIAPEPVEEWGGIAYALAAFEATLPEDWVLVPLIKVGRDVAGQATAFLGSLSRVPPGARFVEVPEPNNRVVLHYSSIQRRTECMSGGIPGWRWPELGPMVRDLDALYVNFISGFELDLDTARALRRGFSGPMYADFHSLLLDVAENGLRRPKDLPDAPAWFSCFDVVQLNEDEMARVGPDPMATAASAFDAGVGLLVVTLGPRGAAYVATPSFTFRPRDARPAGGPLRTARLPAPEVLESGDPTGCGDVFGATLVARLLEGEGVEAALADANRMAARNVTARGASRLHYHLRGAIAPR
ncbi:MAG: carbohydrate kinase family protein [Gemmatimonadetes bacterium]|nr:carbohydrate kinase family protein [Gemmatimonadota bacterium]MBI2401362.1 carbohydrate kinase family protein [Gemmatimonadota bacterium]